MAEIRTSLVAIALLLSPAPLLAQLQGSVVSGRVFAPDGSPMRDARVTLLDPLGNGIAAALSDAGGRYRLASVAPGVYHVRAEAAPLRSPSHRLTVLHGLPLELDELAARPGADLVDFEHGRVKPYATLDLRLAKRLVRRQRLELTARASLLNLLDARYAFNFGNPFSGTHFGAPRGASLDLRLALPRP